MEYWSVEKKDLNPLAITPTLQHSNTPKLIELKVPTIYYLFWGYRSVFFFAGRQRELKAEIGMRKAEI